MTTTNKQKQAKTHAKIDKQQIIPARDPNSKRQEGVVLFDLIKLASSNIKLHVVVKYVNVLLVSGSEQK